MDSISCHSKFAELKDFKHKNCIVRFVTKSEIIALHIIPCYSIIHVYAPVPLKYWIFLINPFFWWTILTFNNPAVERCRFIFFIWRFGITCHERANEIHVHGYPLVSGTKLLQIKQKGQQLITGWLTFSLTSCLHYMTFTVTYIINITGFPY